MVTAAYWDSERVTSYQIYVKFGYVPSSSYRGLEYKKKSSMKTDSLLANMSSSKTYSLFEDLFANRESVFVLDLFLYSSPLGGVVAEGGF